MEPKDEPLQDGVRTVVGECNLGTAGSIFDFEISEDIHASGNIDSEPCIRDLVKATRFVAIGNRALSPLGEFVRAVFGQVAIHPVSSDDIAGITRDLQTYAIMVVLTDDVPRTKKMLREIAPLLRNRLCYAVMTESNPQARARLLRSTFDDVFDMRSNPREILLRIHAQRARQAVYDSSRTGDADFERFCEENLDGTLHRLQMPLLKRLYDNMGEVVRFRDLAAYDFHSGEFRLQSLAVRIHYLRRKLKNCDIRCKRGEGYALVRLEDAVPSVRKLG